MNILKISKSARSKIQQIISKTDNKNKFLRVEVKGGGCSGFQYVFKMDNKKNSDDKIFADGMVVADEMSLEFLSNATVDYVDELGGQYFKIINPNATANCGCGSSFSL